MATRTINDVLPEWEPFTHAIQSRRPDTGTWCTGWTTSDILIHQTANADELHRVLSAHMSGHPVPTRSFETREAHYRAMTATDLWQSFTTNTHRLADLAQAATLDLPSDEKIQWTGRTVTPAFFAEHLRQELVLHRWDLTGDDHTATTSLTQPWMTRHSVQDVGKPLLARGSAALNLNPTSRFEARLRSPGADDILVTVTESTATIALTPLNGEATIESDPAARTLFLWGRRPADNSRWHSQAGPEALRLLRALLSGY